MAKERGASPSLPHTYVPRTSDIADRSDE
jgi:hypothetical protein